MPIGPLVRISAAGHNGGVTNSAARETGALSMVRSSIVGLLSLATVVCASLGAWAGEFDRIEGEALAGVPRSKHATAHTSLTVREIESLPNTLRESRGALLIAATDQGN